jgi:hypothetical protein
MTNRSTYRAEAARTALLFVHRQFRFARGERAYVDEAAGAGIFGRVQHRPGAFDIASLKACRIAGIEHAGDMDHGVDALGQMAEAVGMV